MKFAVTTAFLLAALPAFAQQPPEQPDPLTQAVLGTTDELTKNLIQWRTRALQDETTIADLHKQIAALKAEAEKAKADKPSEEHPPAPAPTPPPPPALPH